MVIIYIMKCDNNIYSYNNISFQKRLTFISPARYYLGKVGKDINPISVENTPWYIKKMIGIFTPKRLKELVQVNRHAAYKTKTFLDNKFGENNYTLIVIGRSAASIAETMKLYGADVKNIPMSGLRTELPSTISGLKKYKKYLKKIGLDENTLKKHPKHKYIIMDYAYSGQSLSAAEKFFKKYIFKEPNDNVIKMSINQILDSEFEPKSYHILFSLSRFKMFSPVGQLGIQNLRKCVNQATPHSAQEYQSTLAQLIRKLYLFHTINNIDSVKYVRPVRELNALDNQYFSKKAAEIRYKIQADDFEIKPANSKNR